MTVKPWAGGEISLGYRSSIRHSLQGELDLVTPAGVGAQLIRSNLNLPEIVTLGLKQDLNPQWTVTARCSGRTGRACRRRRSSTA